MNPASPTCQVASTLCTKNPGFVSKFSTGAPQPGSVNLNMTGGFGGKRELDRNGSEPSPDPTAGESSADLQVQRNHEMDVPSLADIAATGIDSCPSIDSTLPRHPDAKHQIYG